MQSIFGILCEKAFDLGRLPVSCPGLLHMNGLGIREIMRSLA